MINDAAPFLDSQKVSSPAIREWVANLAGTVQQAEANDQHVRHILETSPAAASEASALFQQLHPTAPLLAANLTSLGQVAVTYNQSLEQLLVLLPASVSALKTINVPDQNVQRRIPRLQPESERTPALHDRVPPGLRTARWLGRRRSDAHIGPDLLRGAAGLVGCVRGARNLPCMDTPGKRAPTVEICKSDEPFIPSGTNPWVGDPTPTTGNSAAPASHTPETPAPQIGTASYNPRSGQYQAATAEHTRKQISATRDLRTVKHRPYRRF